jgi:hypothetical protein
MRHPRWGVLPADLYGKVSHDILRKRGGRVYWFGSGNLVISWRRP